MLLAVDIGNTHTVVGLFRGEVLKDHFRIWSRPNITGDEIGFFLGSWLQRMKIVNEEINAIAVASVVPSLTSIFDTTAKKHFGCIPLIVSSKINLPIKIDIPQPDQVGADRICNAVAAFSKFGGPVTVVDFGTATNFDIVDGDGAYIGGVLLPGPETSMAELAKRAARLFEVRIEPPDSVVGKSTAGALKSGLFYGTVGQIDFLIDKIIEETGFANMKVVATGGFAKVFGKHCRHTDLVEPTLTLEGLRLIAEMNLKL